MWGPFKSVLLEFGKVEGVVPGNAKNTLMMKFSKVYECDLILVFVTSITQ